MELSFEREGLATYALVAGRVDGATAGGLPVGVLDAVGDADRALVLDLAAATYVSSAGLRAFLAVAKSLRRENVNFGICALTPGVREVFEITGFDRALAVFDSREAARSALLLE